MGFVGRRDFKLYTDPETIERDLSQSGEYHPVWESED